MLYCIFSPFFLNDLLYGLCYIATRSPNECHTKNYYIVRRVFLDTNNESLFLILNNLIQIKQHFALEFLMAYGF